MLPTSLHANLKSFRHSWVHHTAMQVATLSVLIATYSVVVFLLSASMNLRRALASWSDHIQVTAYLRDDLDQTAVADIQKEIEKLPGVARSEWIPKEKATAAFKAQMASYAPDLMADSEFANPFPASLRVFVSGGVQSADDLKSLQTLAAQIGQLPGVEDVSYGQSWVHTFSSFVTVVTGAGLALILILTIGGIFVIANSVRASISMRRTEIEILELVGATSSYIRRPYVVEGLIMGALAAAAAVAFNYILHIAARNFLANNFAIARLSELLTFLNSFSILGFVVGGGILGGFAAWLTVRKINTGWSAAQGLES